MNRHERNQLLKQALAAYSEFGRVSGVYLDDDETLVINFVEYYKPTAPKTFLGYTVRLGLADAMRALGGSGRRAHRAGSHS